MRETLSTELDAGASHRRGAPASSRRGPRLRRGSTIVECMIIASLYFTFVFATVEFCWISSNRIMMTNGCARAARDGAIGKGTTQMKADVRDYSHLSIADSYIHLEQNPNSDGSGTW